MPDPKFSKPWHGVPKDQINWHPTVLEEACIGCGTCVTGCSRLVYRFDFERKKPVVVDPMNCMVGCTTCANTCPAHAIRFPPMSEIFALENSAAVHHAIEDDLIARRDVLALQTSIPHPDRLVQMQVAGIQRPNPDTLLVHLEPAVAGECFCQFAPGQYVEVMIPQSGFMTRSYSISNAPRADGSIDLQVRRVKDGRLSDWAFNRMQVGDSVTVRGPLGSFTMRSAVDRPLLFVAGGTGLAPVHALLMQQLALTPQRDMVLVWGVGDARDFYRLDLLEQYLQQDKNLRVVLVAERGLDAQSIPAGMRTVSGNVVDALRTVTAQLAGRDAYLAGPPGMLAAAVAELRANGLAREQILTDAFGLE